MVDLYSAKDYRPYLRQALEALPLKGAKSRLATKLNCKPAFVSRVLSGIAHISIEHTIPTSHFLDHSKNERDFFLDLYHYSRAGTDELRQHYGQRLEAARLRRGNIAKRVSFKDELSTEQKEIYYSHWLYATIHVLVLIEGLRSELALAEHLQRPLAEVQRVVDFLLETGLLDRRGEKLVNSQLQIHLPAKSPFVMKHHTNWRVRAIDEFHRQKKGSVHFSGPMSMTKEKGSEIQKKLTDFTIQLLRELPPEKDENAFCLNIDFFSL